MNDVLLIAPYWSSATNRCCYCVTEQANLIDHYNPKHCLIIVRCIHNINVYIYIFISLVLTQPQLIHWSIIIMT